VENNDSPAAINLNSADTPTATEDDREEGELEPGECIPTDEFPKPPNGAPPPLPSASVDDGHLSGTRSSGHYSDRRYNSMARSHSEIDRDRESHGRSRYHNNNDFNNHRYINNNINNNTNGGQHPRLVSPHGYKSAPRSGHRTMSTGGNYGESRSEQRVRPINAAKRTAADLDPGTGGSDRRSDGKRARHLQEAAMIRDSELIDARVQEARKESNVRKPKTKFGNISLAGAFSINDFEFTESNRVGAGTFGWVNKLIHIIYINIHVIIIELYYKVVIKRLEKK
jgi:hypothetical protein